MYSIILFEFCLTQEKKNKRQMLCHVSSISSTDKTYARIFFVYWYEIQQNTDGITVWPTFMYSKFILYH